METVALVKTKRTRKPILTKVDAVLLNESTTLVAPLERLKITDTNVYLQVETENIIKKIRQYTQLIVKMSDVEYEALMKGDAIVITDGPERTLKASNTTLKRYHKDKTKMKLSKSEIKQTNLHTNL